MFLPASRKYSASSASSDDGSCSPPRRERSPPRPSHHSSPQRKDHSSVGLSRKNRPQRCSICKETGHKSRTCRLATGKDPDAMMTDAAPAPALGGHYLG